MSTLGCRSLEVSIADVQVVSGLDLEISPGQFWGLLGPNGIGKTTLLNCLAGLNEPQGGEVLLESRPLAELPRKLIARHIGMLQQHTVYVFDSSVLQTALTGRHPHLGYWERENAEDVQLAQRALETVDLQGFAQRSVTGLSGGEARRLAFATLLIQQTDLLLLDEPTNHLDLRHQIRIMEMISNRVTSNQHAAFAALHDINLAARYCTHLLMLFGDGAWRAGKLSDLLTAECLEKLYGCAVERLESSSGPRFHPAPVEP